MKNIGNRLIYFLILLTVILGCKNETSEAEDEIGSDSSKPYVVEVEAIDYAFKMPKEMKSGWVTFRFKNMGDITHVAQILRLEDDISRKESDSILASGSYPKIDGVMGGPGLHSAGESSEITVNLTPGTYLMICGVKTEDGRSHYDLGMTSHITVIDEVGSAKPPKPDMSIKLKNYRVNTEGELSAGRRTVKIDGNNAKFDVHMIEDQGESGLQAAFDYFSDLKDPTSAEFLGGAEEGFTSYVTLDIEPGNYVWSSHEYGEWGMYERFKITENGEYQKIQEFKNKTPEIAKISISEDTIRVSANFKSGQIQFQLINNSGEEHQIALGRLEEGKDFEDYKNYLDKMAVRDNNENVKNPRSGYKVLFSESSELLLNLKSGTYLVFCDMGKLDEENLHIMNGELASFAIQ